MVKGLIFCAGLGTRLGKLTKDKAKAMIDINGKPCLERIADSFNALGIDKIIVNTHWQAMSIMSYFADRFLYTFEPILLGENITLHRLKHWLAEDFVLVANGDTLTNCDLNFLLETAMNYDCNVRLMDKDVYAGYMVLHPDYFMGNVKFINIEVDGDWVDIGTPEGLKKARLIFK
jgi:NDP-sugar pyrophosphorylase family protein